MYLCPRCKGDAGKFCLVCNGSGVYTPSNDPEEARGREGILQLHVQLDTALADVETVKQKYLEAIAALPEALQRAPGTLADAVRALTGKHQFAVDVATDAQRGLLRYMQAANCYNVPELVNVVELLQALPEVRTMASKVVAEFDATGIWRKVAPMKQDE